MNRRELLRAAIVAGSTGGLGSLAGCTGGGGTYGGGGGTSNPSTTTDSAEPGGGTDGPAVSVRSTDEYGDILVGPDGLSLYLFEKDTNGEMASTCYDSCANAWPPLTVSEEPTKGDGVTASLSTFEREDGSTQVAAAGWPLYYYAADEKPGDTNGQEVDGFGGEWYLLGPDGKKKESEEESDEEAKETTAPTVSVRSTDEYGDILVGPDGLSLYLFEKDTNGEMASTCYDSCANAWPPLTVSEEPTKGDGVTASLSTFERDDGSTQVAAAGWPLYYFVKDEKPGDTNGQEVEGFGAEWYLLGPDGKKKEGGEMEETTTDSGY
ncbi:MAG: hypothetical protein ABEJ06_04765 [Haloarculaceae archaeon]